MRIVQYNANADMQYEFRLVIGNDLSKNQINRFYLDKSKQKEWIFGEFTL